MTSELLFVLGSLALVLIVLGAVGVTAWFVARAYRAQIELLNEGFREREFERNQYIAELHNRLSSDNWQEFTALQQSAPTSVDKTVGALSNIRGPEITDEDRGAVYDDLGVAWGESEEDQREADMLRRGVDLEGPILGG